MPAVATTFGELPAIAINGANGAQAIVTLYGGHLISWKTGDGRQRLFCSAKSALDGTRAIRGGVPVIFPQFAERGTGMRHGFARVSTWRMTDSGDDFAVFTLSETDLAPAHAQAWAHGFTLELKVALSGDAIELTLDVRNSGKDAFAFSSALHTYFQVDQLEAIGIGGLQHGHLHISDKLDQIFRDVGGELELKAPSGTLHLSQKGFRDAVVWNPGAADAAALADMDDAEYQHFVCVEPVLLEPATLVPGASWRGWHRIEPA